MTHSSTAFYRSASTTWRWTLASDRRRRSRRGGKSAARVTLQARVLPLLQLLPNQETVAEHDQDGVAMKAVPEPTLILIPAKQRLAFFVKLLDPVARSAIHPGDQRRRARHDRGGL